MCTVPGPGSLLEINSLEMDLAGEISKLFKRVRSAVLRCLSHCFIAVLELSTRVLYPVGMHPEAGCSLCLVFSSANTRVQFKNRCKD